MKTTIQSTKFTRNLAILAGLLLILAGSTSIAEWRITSLIFGLLLSLVFLFLVIWIGYEKNIQPWKTVSFAFAVIYVVFTSFNYSFTLVFLGRNIQIPELMQIERTDSAFLAIEMLGYFFLGLCTSSMIPLFGYSNKEKAIKALFLLNGFLGIGGLIGYIIDLPMSLMYWGLLLWNIIMPLACFILFSYFNSILKSYQ